jgi:hypothetical protein
MNTRPKKTAEEMRKYKREWAREHSGLKGRPKNNKNQNTDKTHCIRGHEFTAENTHTKPNVKGRQCRECRRLAAKETFFLDNKKIRERARAKWSVNPDSPEKRKRKSLNKIGWTPELFEACVKEQEGTCAICKKVLTFEKKMSGSKGCADHEHSKPPKPRGVLCATCNLGIGQLQDSAEVLESALAYIRKYE